MRSEYLLELFLVKGVSKLEGGTREFKKFHAEREQKGRVLHWLECPKTGLEQLGFALYDLALPVAKACTYRGTTWPPVKITCSVPRQMMALIFPVPLPTSYEKHGMRYVVDTVPLDWTECFIDQI